MNKRCVGYAAALLLILTCAKVLLLPCVGLWRAVKAVCCPAFALLLLLLGVGGGAATTLLLEESQGQLLFGQKSHVLLLSLKIFFSLTVLEYLNLAMRTFSSCSPLKKFFLLSQKKSAICGSFDADIGLLQFS